LCHDGDVTWLRLTPRARDDADAPVGAPSKATPISVVFRADLDWLLAAARADAPVVEPTVGATAEILEVLRARGACFAGQIAATTRRPPDDVERGLWDGVARGLLTSDGFGAIRARVTAGRDREQGRESRRLSRLVRGARPVGASAGRWSLVRRPDLPAPTDAGDRHELAEAVAEQLLNRWGVVFRDLVRRDGFRVPWRDVQWALRRLERPGLLRRAPL